MSIMHYRNRYVRRRLMKEHLYVMASSKQLTLTIQADSVNSNCLSLQEKAIPLKRAKDHLTVMERKGPLSYAEFRTAFEPIVYKISPRTSTMDICIHSKSDSRCPILGILSNLSNSVNLT